MNKEIDQLIDLIKQEEEVLERFLSCLTRQKEFIVQNNIEEFDKTVEEEQELIQTIQNLEHGRMSIVKSIASASGSEENELTLTRLIELNLGESSKELKSLKRGLATLVGRIKKANKVNQYLIKSSLSFIQKNIDWFIDDANLNVIYQSDGRQTAREVGNVLVNKVL